MKMVKSLLLGSAAGLVAVVGAQAADLPVKAKAVEYVKVCSLYGAGFWYVPGTDTCIKLGSYIRVQADYNGGGGGIVVGSGGPLGAGEAVQGRFNRAETNDFNFRNRAAISLDTRTQTEYGTLRSYFRIGVQQTTPGDSPAGAVFWDRAFIQFAGFTVGRTQSFFDLFTFGGAMTYLNVRTSGDTGAAGVTTWAYTAQFGNGLTATIAAEDPGGHNRGAVTDFSTPFTAATAGSTGPWSIGATTNDSAFANQTATQNGFRMPDIIGNLRLDQAWGFVGVSGALHEVGGAYYGSSACAPAGGAIPAAAAGANCESFGHPGDRLGWAVAVGGLLNVPGLPGDKFGVNLAYSEGATGYVQNTGQWTLYSGSRSVGLGWATDGVFDCPGGVAGGACATGTSVELTRAWSINAAYEHVWTPQLRTSVYGGYVNIDYNAAATNIINSRIAGGAATCGATAGVPTTFGAIALSGVAGSNSCSPDFSFWQVGSRTQWNPARDLDIGVDVLYTRLNTAYEGTAVVAPVGAKPAIATPAGGALAGAISDQDVWTVMFRWQRNFLP